MGSFAVNKPQPDCSVVAFPSEVMGGQDALDLATMVRESTQEGSKSIVFDLANVQFMNSSGLGMLVSSLTTLRKQGVGLKLASVPEKVTSLLEMTQLTQIFDIYPTVSDAVGPK